MRRYTFRDFYRDAMDYVLLNLIFIMFVALGAFVTLGASLKAMFFVSHRLLDREKQTYVWKDFLRSFKEDFLQSTLVWLTCVALGLLLYLAWTFAFEQQNIIVMVSIVATATIMLVYLMYFYPLLALFEAASFGERLRNTFIIMARHPFTTVKLLGSLALVVLLFLLFSGTIIVSIGIFAWLWAWHLKKPLEPIIMALSEVPTDIQLDKET
ncbi:MAG: DUF624 domain-containing protein [Bacilli bacterium]|nr:DUF624 domain-containing protein [Bacilli bacterium]